MTECGGIKATKMRFKFFAIVCLCAAAILAADLFESSAEAAFLKNGVRPGNRTKMHIVRRPSPGARKRIYAPGERRAVRKSGGGTRRSERHAWFWKKFDPGLSAANGSRWDLALRTMAERRVRGKSLVSSETLRAIMSSYRTDISHAAARHGVSEALLTAVIAIESRGKPNAVSPAGAKGLMQLMPGTAKRFGVKNVFDETQNIRGGASYLNWLLREFRGDVLLALAGYNAGEGAVRKHKGVPPYAETRDYVVLVMDALAAMQNLCVAPVTTPRTRCSLPRAAS